MNNLCSYIVLTIIFCSFISCQNDDDGAQVMSCNDEFELAFGDSKAFTDCAVTSISFREVIVDDRCPEDVECRWLGYAEVDVYLFFGDLVIGTHLATIQSDSLDLSPVYTFGDWEIELIDVHPKLLSTETYTDEDYRITLRVSEN